MKVKDIYQLAIKLGIEADPRAKKKIDSILKEAEKEYKDLKKEDKELYDTEKIKNPFPDTRVFIDNGKEIKKILVGIDMESSEILLAERLNEKGEGIDLVMAHHPEGNAYANLSLAMGVQADVNCVFGVPINVAESVLGPRMGEISRAVHPANHQRPVDMARILKINFMCMHTPADNNVQKYLQDIFDTKKPEKVSDVVNTLKEIPEYRAATKLSAGPKVFCGSEDRSAGKVMVDMTGGTGGPKEAYEKLSQAGVGTIVGMHISEDSKKEAEQHHINVVIAGHIASDSLGMNLILDKLEEKGIEIVPCSGLIRVNRGKKK